MISTYASPARRITAHAADAFAIFALALATGMLGGWRAFTASGVSADDPTLTPESLAGIVQPGVTSGVIIGLLAGCLLNFALTEGWAGASLGKLLLGIRVVRTDGTPIGIGTAFVRMICFFIGGLPFYAGYASIFSNQEKQCWHDRICKTVVILRGAKVHAQPTHLPKGESQKNRAA